MTETHAQDLARTPRYQVSDAIRVFVEGKRNGDPATPADLLDLSIHGAQLALPAQVASGDAIRIRFENPELGIHLPIESVVRWARRAQDSSWLLGCSFCSPLPADTIESLKSIGYLEADEPVRVPTAAELTAWQEMHLTSFTVQLAELSAGGISILSPDPVQVGSRLRLLSSDAGAQKSIIVKVRCCAEIAKGYLVGCQFETRASYGLLRRQATPGQPIHQPSNALNSQIVRRSYLISRTTILILSGILIGMSLGFPAPLLMSAGMSGVVAYLALEFTAAKWRQRNDSRWQQFISELFEQRLDERFEQLQAGWTIEPIV